MRVRKGNWDRANDVRIQLTIGLDILFDKLNDADRAEIKRIIEAFYRVPGESQVILLFPDGHSEHEELLRGPEEDDPYMERFARKIISGRMARLMSESMGKIIFVNNQGGERMYSVLSLENQMWNPVDKAGGYRTIARCGITEPGAYYTLPQLIHETELKLA